MRPAVDPIENPASGNLRVRRIVQHPAARYLVAGGIAFLFDIGLLALLKNVFGWPLGIATGTAFLGSFAFTYTIQRYFSFGSTSPHGRALLKYAALVGINTLATVAIVTLINPTPLGWVGGKVIATCASLVWNYFAYRYWVFGSRISSKRE
ncbi:GtrA family protein [Cryobacterium sp. CAN_C3]|uniref:GtrA family protein n=1 Tax=Cryobacterium sp. CAN_C3 TaxID=3071721 RepID=UPI0018C9E273